MFPCIIFVLAATVIGLIVYASIQHAKKIQAGFKDAGRSLGLTYTEQGLFGPRKLRGKVDGYRVQIQSFKRSSGKSSTTWTKFELLYRKQAFEYKLTRARALSGVAAIFGAQDIEVGSEEFDRAVIVKSDREKHIKAFLTPERQKAVMTLLMTYPGAVIKTGELEWEKQGSFTSANDIEAVMRRFVDTARVLEGRRAKTPEAKAEVVHVLEPVYEPPGGVEPAAVREVDAGPAPRAGALEVPPPVEPTEPSFAAPAADPIEPNPPPAPAVPPDAEPAEVALPASEPEAAPAETETGASASLLAPAVLSESALGGESDLSGSSPPAPAPDTAPTRLSESAREVSEDLFAAGGLGSEIEKTYREHYDGAGVRWKGRLERLDTYYSDMVFGSGPGTKATLVLHEIADDYGSRKVECVLQLDEQAATELRDRIGQELAFEGRLAKCEAFLRRLVIADGQLV